MGKLGIITYNFPHLKTEQVMLRLLPQGRQFKIYALPFTPRKPRETLFAHRPEQSNAASPVVIAKKHGIPYLLCQADTDIPSECDIYLLLGAGLLSPECVTDKRIINCHPGIIPSSRGLDSFKWALYEMKPLGVTLHFLDAEVDAGEILSVVPTVVYEKDTLAALAHRHYENEIDCLSRFEEFFQKPDNPFAGIAAGEARKRMPQDKEREMIERFSGYVQKFGVPAA